MEVYTLDSLLRRETVTDRFISFIWTERFSSYGDFELVLPSTASNRALFKPGVILACNVSKRMMVVTTVEDKTDSDGTTTYRVTGLSLESVLDDRVAKESMSNLTTSPTWTITMPPADVMRKVVHDICVTGILSEDDVIPFIYEGTIMPVSSIEEPTDPVEYSIEPTTVYAVLQDIGAAYSLGFRMVRDDNVTRIYFDVYAGSDRTSSQAVYPPVIFSPELGSLQNTNVLTTADGYKNVAYVFSPLGSTEVQLLNAPPVEGLDRRVLMVKADDISDETLTPEQVQLLLEARGRVELAKLQQFMAFDGEINQHAQYVYDKDYYLGDLIDIRDKDGVVAQMRVTEQIFVSDAEGERSYPTLSANLFIDSGTWLSWLQQQVWSDVAEDVYWETA